MPLLSHALRSDIRRASFHGLEGDAALVPGIAARIDRALAELDPADAPRIAPEIGAALHRIAMPRRGQAAGPLGRLLSRPRERRIDRIERAVRERYLSLPTRHPELACLCCCHPEADIRAAALAVMPDPSSPVHAAIADHARAARDGETRCISV